MDPSKTLHSIWSYLPAFAAVAEAEHLPTAAARLHVVPSALSRSVRLLEDALGERVFDRAGRRLVLNARGRILLDAYRGGAQSLERGLSTAAGSGYEGPFRVGSHGVLTNEVVLPALLDLASAHPGLVPTMRNHRAMDANHHLALGHLDVAFYTEGVPLPGIACRKLGTLGNSVYCGKRHPLFRARRVSTRALREHAFSVPALGDRNTPLDDWPVHLERKVGFQIELLVTNLAVCLSGRFLTVLPDVVAAPHVRAGALRRLPLDALPATEVYVACRSEETEAQLVTELAERVAAIVSN